MNIYTFIFICLALFSCSKRKKCNEKDSYSGIVINHLEIWNDPLYGYVGNDNFMISTDSLYKIAFPNTKDLPFIDFSKHDLLGQYGGGSCSIKFHMEVTSNTASKSYHYKLNQYECSTFHKPYCQSYNWVLVPKLPNGWKVTFEKIDY